MIEGEGTRIHDLEKVLKTVLEKEKKQRKPLGA